MAEVENYRLLIISLLIGYSIMACNCENGALLYLLSLICALFVFFLEYVVMMFIGVVH